MFSQLHMPPVRTWHERFRISGEGARPSPGRSNVRPAREFHDDFSFWRLILETSMGPGGSGTLGTPVLCFYLHSHSRMLVSDASGEMGALRLDTGSWWRIDFDEDTRKRFRAHMQGGDDLFSNVLGLLAMIVTA